MDIAVSTNKVPIRLTNERWHHISIGHPEIVDYYYDILETIENPSVVYRGSNDELIAVSFKVKRINKHIIAVYKELTNSDGFIITAFISNKLSYLDKKEIVWKAKQR